MNEPTGGGQHQPDARQDQTSGSVFSDPTASIWAADPTAPVPPAPPGPVYAYGQQPAAPQAPAPTAPPLSNPYAQQPPVQQYGQPPVQPYGQPQAPAYGQPQMSAYGQPYGTGAPSRTNGSAVTLTVLSAISILFCNVVAIASLVLGIIALNINATDPEASRRMSNIGWIVFGVGWGLAALFFLVNLVS